MYRYLLYLAMVLICNTALYAVDLVGKVTDADDKPLAGVRIDVLRVTPLSRINESDKFDSSVRLYKSSRHPECRKFATTDKAGKFIIPNADPDLSYWLAASVADKQISFAPYAPKDKERITIKMEDYPEIDEDHWLKGKVIDRNDAPVPHAFVEAEYFHVGKEDSRVSTTSEDAFTDENGAFRIPIKDDTIKISFKASADGYSEIKVESEDLSKPLHLIKIPTGTRLTGKLVANGKPAVNQQVAVVQLDQSVPDVIGYIHYPNIRQHYYGPTHDHPLQANPNFISAVTATTDDEGRFIFENLPEDELYAIYTPHQATGSKWAVRTSYFKAKENDQTFDLGVIPLVRTVTLAGKVVMPEGETIGSASVVLKHSPAFNSIKVPLNSKGEFRVENLSPETYQIAIPKVGLMIDESTFGCHVINDQNIAIHASKDREDIVIPLRKPREEEAVELKVEQASEALLLTMKMGKEDAIEQALTGIVVNPMENPLGGISVSAIPLNLQKFTSKVFLPSNAEVSTRSCPEGRFVLDALSDQLMVLEVKSPAAERARFGDSKLPMFPHAVGERRVEKNQKDIRIIFDPEVFTKIPEIK